ncbi:hypothetical protein [Fimbriimonas ginsengisoli]|uniref:Uncharacterized protein n=1 Tax=Fimbriimonas ginsengisoli Gsoil 348 TaxID=661478 RepID=A0A068NMZ2_FIMGI|nr:hypothetical protein [Fimbriimonas ginsengisoli]AIE84836.1 hypothetical protein OP10G_1468 [Fimbriimonas ginsengisoli Gsoil 348]
MNGQGEALFLDGVMLICAIMALVNVGRFKSRGASAYLLGGAFIVLGGTVYAYSQNAPMPLLGTGGLVVFLLLAGDMVYRIGRQR